jgi:DNA-binding transcriptional regulator YdaS (Cro superfamily)
MNLDSYLKEIGKAPCTWAHENGIAPPIITRFLNGRRGLSARTAIKIHNLTKGQVPLRHLCPDLVDQINEINDLEARHG